MPVRVYSTLSGQKEDLVPAQADGVLRMYVCGMTPKFHPHVGHARLFVGMDVIRRYLEYRGYTVRHIQNFTDIDDKIIQRAESEGRTAEQAAQSYIDSYFRVMDALNVVRATEYPRVTLCIPEIISFIDGLIRENHAYPVDGDVYFSVASFPQYGKLSRRDLESQRVAVRKEMEPGKHDPLDFALWKHARSGEPCWDSPWGAGRPGWHIECSAMARATLGDQIDIHGGGSDLIFPHHENEIAQSEALTGLVPFARHWLHTGLVTTEGEKMAHSLENFFTIENLIQKYPAENVRYYLLATHYRSPLSFVIEGGQNGQEPRVRGVDEAGSALDRLRRAVGHEPLAEEEDYDQATVDRFTEAMDDDFNTPAALASLFDLARDLNRLRTGDGTSVALEQGRRTIVHLAGVLGLDLAPSQSGGGANIGPFVDLLLDLRARLRGARQWEMADEIRVRLGELGVTVEDKPGGQSGWRISDPA